jgi:hypothetical protein
MMRSTPEPHNRRLDERPEPKSGAECVKLAAGGRMRERRTSGSQRGRASIVLGETRG